MRRSTRIRRWLIALLVLTLLGVGGWYGARWISERYQVVLPLTDQCLASVQADSASLTPAQTELATKIVGEAQRRRLAPRASSIALATAMQESGIRNLDYGDRDSLGLFQQRPSQGWGTPEQIMDPWYASGKFFDALVKIPNWRDADLNDIAQKIQISGHPEAYRKHVPAARLLASALTGETPASFGCRVGASAANPQAAKVFLERVFGKRITIWTSEQRLTVIGASKDIWSAAALSIGNASTTGLYAATVGDTSWNRTQLTWSGTVPQAKQLTLQLSFGEPKRR